MQRQIAIDRAGRVVIPKRLRDRLGLSPGDSLTVEETGDGITLKPTLPHVPLIREHGIWVYRTGNPVRFSVAELIDEVRNERMAAILK